MTTVLAETTVQVLVDDIVVLPLPAIKVDEITARIDDLQCYVIDDKVIFQGILHKQIFYVDTDNVVRHVAVDIPFSGFADLPGVPAGSACSLTATIAFLSFQLLNEQELRETVVIDVEIIVYDLLQNTITFTNTLPNQSVRFGERQTVRVSGPSGGVPG